MTVGQKIKAARIQAGLTQKDLAGKLGIPYQSIGQWERGVRNPKVSSLNRIAVVLGVKPISLYPEDSDAGVELSTGTFVYAKDGKITLTPESQKELDRREKQYMQDPEFRQFSEEIDALIEEYKEHKDDPSELKLLQAYHKLTFEGQKKTFEYMDTLLGNPRFVRGDDDAEH